MNTTARQITYRATFVKSIVGPVLQKLTRSKRAVPLAELPTGVADYLCLSRPNQSAPWCFTEDDKPGTWERFIALDEVKLSRPRKTSIPQATVTFSVDRPRPDSPEVETLPQTWHDGSHCGLTDWYDSLESAIVAAIARGRKACWTTGWYASKKEIASARITCAGGEITAEVSVSDDLDTEGHGSVTIPYTKNLDKLRAAVDAAWNEAGETQKDNRLYYGFSVGREGRWEFTIILPAGEGHHMETPPGDNYHRWGWQEVEDGKDHPAVIPANVAKLILDWATDCDEGEATYGGWTAKMWKD
jgi:hypothetical protein